MDNAEKVLGRKAELLLKTGQLLIQCLANSNRVDRNLRRVARFMGIPDSSFHMHITYTTLMINLRVGGYSVTRFQKCSGHGPNMAVLTKISHLSWRANNENYSLDRYEKELNEIAQSKKIYPVWLVTIVVGIACGSFGRLFGCDLPAAGITAVAASSAVFIRQQMNKRHYNHYLTTVICAFIAVCLASLITRLNLSATPQHPLFACVLFLIPGVPLINSLDDMIDGYTIVGFTRGIVATLIIVSISFGMVSALALFSTGLQGAELSPHSGRYVIAFFAALAACGFAVLFNAPKHTLIAAACCGAIAVVLRNLLYYEVGLTLPFATFCGAFTAAFISLFVRHLVHVPVLIIAIPAVIPMIPGILMYEAMIGMVTFNVSGSTEQINTLVSTVGSGMTAVAAIFAISLGVAIPNLFGRWIDRIRKPLA